MPRTANPKTPLGTGKPARCWKCGRGARLYYISGAEVNVCGRCLAVCKGRMVALDKAAQKRRNQLEAEVSYMIWEGRRYLRR